MWLQRTQENRRTAETSGRLSALYAVGADSFFPTVCVKFMVEEFQECSVLYCRV